jgi:tripartite-type tricarboxylate transporter receptor subunit TctC
VTTATRFDAMPGVPILADFVPGYGASAWYGAGVPRNTPAEIIAELNKEINAGFADPKMKVRFADLGGTATNVTTSSELKCFTLIRTHLPRMHERSQGASHVLPKIVWCNRLGGVVGVDQRRANP